MPREYTVPYTEDELDGIRAIFRSLPSYQKSLIEDPENGPYMTIDDCELWAKRLGWPVSPTQIEMHRDYWIISTDGKVKEDFMVEVIRVVHDPILAAKFIAKSYDRNKDGIIQENEFEDALKKLFIHFPSIPKLSFDQFVKEADTDGDGLVSLAELDDWLEKNIKQ